MVTENPTLRLNLSRPTKLSFRKTEVGLDIVLLASALILAYELRFDFNVPPAEIQHLRYQLPFVLLLQLGLLWFTGVYDFIWRYVGLAEVKSFIVAALWSAFPLIVLRTWLPEQLHLARIPLSIILVDTAVAFGGVLSLRVLSRALHERDSKRQAAKSSLPTQGARSRALLIGAGRAGVMVAREIKLRGDMDLDVMGFVDDDRKKLGSVIQGIKVLGTTDDIPRLVSELSIDHVVITFAEASRQRFRHVLEICERVPVRVRTVPGLYDLLQGNFKVSRIRDVEIEDLLGREKVQLDEARMRDFMAGKTVMITGAGGSIGSELARQVARFGPERILLVERAEFALFAIDHELRESAVEVNAVPLVADVGDRERMQTIFREHKPDVILHAAAHKHVPMMENNPTEAIRNNVLATRLLGEMAAEFGVQAFVLISTDKAVSPTSVMGASKRLAELVIQDLNRKYNTRYQAVRFGNVIGSAGSVIPIFREQIRKGGPVTVTHPKMVRYFMTIPEAAQLVLQAATMGEGGEIFVLDMGEPVNILDLAKDTITLSGLKPFEDINIVFTGIRPGEKLFEELQTTDEQIIRTSQPKIFIGRIATCAEKQLADSLERLSRLIRNGSENDLRRVLNEILPEAQLRIPEEENRPKQKILKMKAVASGNGDRGSYLKAEPQSTWAV